MDNPKISVIIPAYNAKRFLPACLDSLAAQTYKNFEIIVVDDCSSDNTAEIAKAAGAIVIRNPKNLGEGASRNAGVKKATGEIIAHSDADVVVPPFWLQNIVNDMQVHNVQCVAGNYIGCLGNSFIENFSFQELVFRRKEMPKFVPTAVANNFACTRLVFDEAGGFPPKYKCEDMVLTYKISRRYKIFWDKNNGVYHHFRDTLFGYLRQQYFFARDTVITYGRLPELLKIKTHQGRQLYFEAILTFLFYIMLVFIIQFAWLLVLFIILINVNFLRFLVVQKLNLFKSVGVILLRDIIVTFGIVVGAFYSLKYLIKNNKNKL